MFKVCAHFLISTTRKVHDGSYSRHHWRRGRHSLHHRGSEIRRPQQQEVSMNDKLMEKPRPGRSIVIFLTKHFLKSKETLKPSHPF